MSSRNSIGTAVIADGPLRVSLLFDLANAKMDFVGLDANDNCAAVARHSSECGSSNDISKVLGVAMTENRRGQPGWRRRRG